MTTTIDNPTIIKIDKNKQKKTIEQLSSRYYISPDINKCITGSPPKYNNPEDLKDRIEDYFHNGYKTKTKIIRNKQGEAVDTQEIPYITIAGLCNHLGFESRQSFYDYGEKPQFSYFIKRARLFIEQEYEELLRDNPVAGIFALKQFGWTDRIDITTTTVDINQLRSQSQDQMKRFGTSQNNDNANIVIH